MAKSKRGAREDGARQAPAADRRPPSAAASLSTDDGQWTTTHALYLIATPIGNLEDITLRALRLLREVRLIAAEDTRHTHILLQHHGITTPLISYHEHNKRLRLARLITELDAGDVALVSDAGTPGLADPGYELVRAVQERGGHIVPVPGPSALLAAVTASGLVPGPFTFIGFPPTAAGERRMTFAQVAVSAIPTIFYEAPHRLLDTLEGLLAACGDREVGIARELTKRHEEIRREPLTIALAHFRANPPRGEFVLILDGQPAAPIDTASGEETLRRLLAAGLAPTAAAKEAARLSGAPRADLYALAVSLKEKAQGVD